MTISQILLMLRARWMTAILVFAVVLAVGVAGTLLVPRNYTASGAVVLDVKLPDPIAGTVLPGMGGSGYMATQAEVFQSERVMLRVIRELRLDQDQDLRGKWLRSTGGQGSVESWIAEQMAKALDVRSGKESNVIVASYTSSNPRQAADIVNALVAAYIATTVELRTSQARDYNSSFDVSTRQLREELEGARARYSDFQQRNGFAASSDERIDAENARLSELSTQLVRIEAQADESSSRHREAIRRGDQMGEFLGNPVVIELSTDLARAQASLRELGERYGDQHPLAIEARASIRELRNRLASEKARIVGSLAVNDAANQSRARTLRSALEVQRAKVVRMKGLRDEAQLLQRDVENAQKSYDAAFGKRSQSMLESQASQTNVSVIKKATVPVLPSSPRVLLNIVVALLVAAILAVVTAITREWRDWRLRTDADVLDDLKQPLLGVLPRRSDTSGWSRGALPLAARRVLGAPVAEAR